MTSYRILKQGPDLGQLHAMMTSSNKWKHFLSYWPFVRGIHRSPVNSPHKGQWRGALMFSLIYDWINDWVNSCEAGDLRRYRVHHYITVMQPWLTVIKSKRSAQFRVKSINGKLFNKWRIIRLLESAIGKPCILFAPWARMMRGIKLIANSDDDFHVFTSV